MGFMGLVLSGAALSAVPAHAVAHRTQEIGVRLALGAQRKQILWLVQRRALFQLALGLVFGVVCAALWDRRWETPVTSTPTRFFMTDPVVLIPVAALLAMVA